MFVFTKYILLQELTYPNMEYLHAGAFHHMCFIHANKKSISGGF